MQIFRSSSLIPYLTIFSNILLSESKNVTVNDDSPEIVYVGKWSNVSDSSGSYMGDHHYTTTIGSKATFNFTGQFRYIYMVVPSIEHQS